MKKVALPISVHSSITFYLTEKEKMELQEFLDLLNENRPKYPPWNMSNFVREAIQYLKAQLQYEMKEE